MVLYGQDSVRSFFVFTKEVKLVNASLILRIMRK